MAKANENAYRSIMGLSPDTKLYFGVVHGEDGTWKKFGQKNNPRREGSAKHQAFADLGNRDGFTIAALRDKGVNPGFIRSSVKKGHLTPNQDGSKYEYVKPEGEGEGESEADAA